jgi:Tat protein translocase TatB subunit
MGERLGFGRSSLDLVEIIVLLAIALVVLGPERLPDVLRTAGKLMRELRAASNTVMRELTDVLEEQPPSIRPARPALPEPTKTTEPTEKT